MVILNDEFIYIKFINCNVWAVGFCTRFITAMFYFNLNILESDIHTV